MDDEKDATAATGGTLPVFNFQPTGRLSDAATSNLFLTLALEATTAKAAEEPAA